MRRVFKHRPIPALGQESERQVVDEFRRVQTTLENLSSWDDAHDASLNPHGKMNWRGDSWDGTEHQEFDVVRDGAWTMVANKTTTDRPAPQTVGDPAYTLPALPVWTELSDSSVIYSGHLYTFTSSGYFRALRIWVPELLASTNYRTVIVMNPNSTNPAYTSIEESVLVEDGWTLLGLDTILISAGEELLVYLDALNQGDSTTWQEPWTYDGPSQTGTPGPGMWNHDSQNTTLRINHVDGNDTSQQQTLRVIVNTVFEVSDLANPEQYFHYRVTGPYTELADHTIYPVTLFDTGAGGPTEGVGQNIRAVQPVPDPTKYVQVANYWATGEPSWATVQGFLQYDGVDQPGHADTAFGIDIAFQQLTQSPDWDVLALSSEGGGGGGGGDFDGLHNDIDGRDAADAHPLASITGVQTGGAGNTFLNDQGTYSAPAASTHNALPGRDASNAHPLASITGIQTGGAGDTWLNNQGLYSAPSSGFDGDHNDLPGLTAPNAHPLASITGIQTDGAGDAWLSNQGLYTAPPGFNGDHNDLNGRSVADAHPATSISYTPTNDYLALTATNVQEALELHAERSNWIYVSGPTHTFTTNDNGKAVLYKDGGWVFARSDTGVDYATHLIALVVSATELYVAQDGFISGVTYRDHPTGSLLHLSADGTGEIRESISGSLHGEQICGIGFNPDQDTITASINVVTRLTEYNYIPVAGPANPFTSNDIGKGILFKDGAWKFATAATNGDWATLILADVIDSTTIKVAQVGLVNNVTYAEHPIGDILYLSNATPATGVLTSGPSGGPHGEQVCGVGFNPDQDTIVANVQTPEFKKVSSVTGLNSVQATTNSENVTVKLVNDATPTANQVYGTNGAGTLGWKDGGVSVHNDLSGRSTANAHPISAITDLETRLSALENASGVEPWVYRLYGAKDTLLPININYDPPRFVEAGPTDGVGANGTVLLASYIEFVDSATDPDLKTAVLEFPTPSDWNYLTIQCRFFYSTDVGNHAKQLVMETQAYIADPAADISGVIWTGGTYSYTTTQGSGIHMQKSAWEDVHIIGSRGPDRQVFFRYRRIHASNTVTGAVRIHSIELRFSR